MVLLGDDAQVETDLGPFGDSGNLDARSVNGFHRTHHPRKSIWMHLMELLCDVDHVESRFGLFGDSVSVGGRKVHGLRRTYHRLRNCL
jgi:hypothetical protein